MKKKLRLKKVTLRDLDDASLQKVAGGTDTFPNFSCNTCETNCGTCDINAGTCDISCTIGTDDGNTCQGSCQQSCDNESYCATCSNENTCGSAYSCPATACGMTCEGGGTCTPACNGG